MSLRYVQLVCRPFSELAHRAPNSAPPFEIRRQTIEFISSGILLQRRNLMAERKHHA